MSLTTDRDFTHKRCPICRASARIDFDHSGMCVCACSQCNQTFAMRRGNKLTKAKCEQRRAAIAIAVRTENLTAKEAACRFRVHTGTVYAALRDYPLSPAGELGRRHTDAKCETMGSQSDLAIRRKAIAEAAWYSGLSKAEIQTKFGVSYTTIIRACNEYSTRPVRDYHYGSVTRRHPYDVLAILNSTSLSLRDVARQCRLSYDRVKGLAQYAQELGVLHRPDDN